MLIKELNIEQEKERLENLKKTKLATLTQFKNSTNKRIEIVCKTPKEITDHFARGKIANFSKKQINQKYTFLEKEEKESQEKTNATQNFVISTKINEPKIQENEKGHIFNSDSNLSDLSTKISQIRKTLKEKYKT